jgi:hypothetical protein
VSAYRAATCDTQCVDVEGEDPMRRLLLAAGMTATLALPAGAEVSDTGVFGYWTTFAGVATDGKPVCGMSTDWGVEGQTTSRFLIKYFGQDELVIHIGRFGWQVPFGQPARVRMKIDQAPTMEIVSHGVVAEKHGSSLLEFAIKRDDVWEPTGKSAIEEFLALLSAGRQITISFPDGSEPPWVGQLAGSQAALQSFMACGATIEAANRGAPGGTQPFSPRQARQPATTQPFRRL